MSETNNTQIQINLRDAADMYKALSYYASTMCSSNREPEVKARCHELLKNNRFIVAERFKNFYEDQWDYSYDVFERGMTLEFFIKERRPDHEWMLHQEQPKHISEIPVSIKEEYLQYLKIMLAEFWDEKPETLNYTLDNAINEFLDSHLLI